MLRKSMRPRTVLQVTKCVKRYSTQDREGVHEYTIDSKLPSSSSTTLHQTTTPLQSSNISQATKSTTTSTPQNNTPETSKPNQNVNVIVKTKKSTIEEKDDEIREKLEAISGGGGGAGVQLEDGKSVGLRRGVRENMFRVI